MHIKRLDYCVRLCPLGQRHNYGFALHCPSPDPSTPLTLPTTHSLPHTPVPLEMRARMRRAFSPVILPAITLARSRPTASCGV